MVNANIGGSGKSHESFKKGTKKEREKKLQPSWNGTVTQKEMTLFLLRQMPRWISSWL